MSGVGHVHATIGSEHKVLPQGIHQHYHHPLKQRLGQARGVRRAPWDSKGNLMSFNRYTGSYSNICTLLKKIKGNSWITHQILMNKLFKLKIFTDVHWIICWERNDVKTVNGNQNYQPIEAWMKSHNKKIKVKHWNDRLIQLAWIISRQLIMWLRSVYGLCGPVCTPDNVWTCSWWVGGNWPGGSASRPGSSVNSLTICGGTWIHRYITSLRCSIEFGFSECEGQSMVSMPSSSLSQHSGHMRPGIVLHQEEPRTHCTSIRFENLSEGFIPVPNRSQGTVGCDMEVCETLQGYASPDHHWPTTKLVKLDDVTGSITFPRVSPDSFTCHMCSMWTCSHLWRGCQWWTCQF